MPHQDLLDYSHHKLRRIFFHQQSCSAGKGPHVSAVMPGLMNFFCPKLEHVFISHYLFSHNLFIQSPNCMRHYFNWEWQPNGPNMLWWSDWWMTGCTVWTIQMGFTIRFSKITVKKMEKLQDFEVNLHVSIWNWKLSIVSCNWVTNCTTRMASSYQTLKRQVSRSLLLLLLKLYKKWQSWFASVHQHPH